MSVKWLLSECHKLIKIQMWLVENFKWVVVQKCEGKKLKNEKSQIKKNTGSEHHANEKK